MKKKLVVEKIARRVDGKRIFSFEVKGSAPGIETLIYTEEQLPPILAEELAENDYVMAEYDAERIYTAEILKEETAAVLRSAEDRLHALFAKGKQRDKK